MNFGKLFKKKEKENENSKNLLSFVLLSQAYFDKDEFIANLKSEWDIDVDVEVEVTEQNDILIFETDGMRATVGLMPGPIPNGEAEQAAAANYLWTEAINVTKSHVAHLLVSVIPIDNDVVEAGKLLVKLCDICLIDKCTIGVYTAGTVFEPEFYRDVAALMSSRELPIFNWVYVGLRRVKEGIISGYTYGLKDFGKDEIEIIGTRASFDELRMFLYNIASYVIESNVILRDGETIGFTADEKLPIQRSKGINLDGETLKIGYKN